MPTTRILDRPPIKAGNLATALALAEAGLPVFPAGPDKRPRVKGWQAKATTNPAALEAFWRRFPDAVPAIPTGARSGVAVLDLDLDQGKGLDGEAALRAAGGLPEAGLVVRTPRGGRHLYFAHEEGLTNAAGHLPSGVDFRGEGGFVIGPGADLGDGRAYAIEEGGLAEVSLGLLPRLPAHLRAPERAEEGRAPPVGPVDLAELEPALRAIPADLPHDEWVRILAALHHAAGGGDQGRALAHDWSRGDPRYRFAEVEAKWRSFGKHAGPPVTAATILAEARRHGWAEDLDGFGIEEDGAGEGETFATIPADACGTRPRPPYIVKGLLGRCQFGAILGQPAVGKSFLAPLMAHCIATGRPFFGRKVRPARVAYLSAEDGFGMELRVRALVEAHGPAPGLELIDAAPDLGHPEEFQRFRRTLREGGFEVVFIDTLAAAMPTLEENDNGPQGMGRAVALAQLLQRDGLAVILVHHLAKAGGTSGRGGGKLQGAFDLTLPLKSAGGIVTLDSPAKNRLGPEDSGIAFRIRKVELDLPPDEDGEPFTSGIAEPCGPPSPECAVPPSTRAALAVLERLAEEAGEPVPLEDWRRACRDDDAVSEAKDRRGRGRAFGRALNALRSERLVLERAGRFLPGDAAALDDFGVDDDD